MATSQVLPAPTSQVPPTQLVQLQADAEMRPTEVVVAEEDFTDSSDPELEESDSELSDEEEGEEDEEEDEEPRKLVLVVRTDLNMSIGKTAAQVGHALHRIMSKARDISSSSSTWEMVNEPPPMEDARQATDAEAQPAEEKTKKDTKRAERQRHLLQEILLWENLENSGSKKITLEVDSFEKLVAIRKHARSLNISTATIQDAGHTEIEAGSVTVLGLGPAKESLLNQVTGKLKTLSDPSKVLKKLLQTKEQQIAKLEKTAKKHEADLKKAKADLRTLVTQYKGLVCLH